MEKVARTIIDQGLLDGGFGGRHQQADFAELPEQFKRQVLNLCKHAILTAREVIGHVDRQSLEHLVNESLALEHELVGEQARTFYSRFLSDDVQKRMREVVKRFMESSEQLLHPVLDTTRSEA
jgi:hypothetical protein